MAYSEQNLPFLSHVVPHAGKEAMVSTSSPCSLPSSPSPEHRPGCSASASSLWSLWICFPPLCPFGMPGAMEGGFLGAHLCLFTSGDLGEEGYPLPRTYHPVSPEPCF